MLFYLLFKSVTSRLGEIAILPIINTWEQIQRAKQNEEIEEYFPNERTR